MNNKFRAKVQELKKEALKKIELEGVTPEWVIGKMNQLKIDRITIRQALRLDESSFSLIMGGRRGMSKGVKAALYYYLAYHEQLSLNKQVVKALNDASKD